MLNVHPEEIINYKGIYFGFQIINVIAPALYKTPEILFLFHLYYVTLKIFDDAFIKYAYVFNLVSRKI